MTRSVEPSREERSRHERANPRYLFDLRRCGHRACDVARDPSTFTELHLVRRDAGAALRSGDPDASASAVVVARLAVAAYVTAVATGHAARVRLRSACAADAKRSAG